MFAVVLRTATLSAERERGDVGTRLLGRVASRRICACTHTPKPWNT